MSNVSKTMIVIGAGRIFSSYWWTVQVGRRRIFSRFNLCYGMGFVSDSSAYGEDGECMLDVGRTLWPSVAGTVTCYM